jgi:hypothetical protein
VVVDDGRTVIQAAREFEVSWPVAQAAFVRTAQSAHLDTAGPAGGEVDFDLPQPQTRQPPGADATATHNPPHA